MPRQFSLYYEGSDSHFSLHFIPSFPKRSLQSQIYFFDSNLQFHYLLTSIMTQSNDDRTNQGFKGYDFVTPLHVEVIFQVYAALWNFWMRRIQREYISRAHRALPMPLGNLNSNARPAPPASRPNATSNPASSSPAAPTPPAALRTNDFLARDFPLRIVGDNNILIMQLQHPSFAPASHLHSSQTTPATPQTPGHSAPDRAPTPTFPAFDSRNRLPNHGLSQQQQQQQRGARITDPTTQPRPPIQISDRPCTNFQGGVTIEGSGNKVYVRSASSSSSVPSAPPAFSAERFKLRKRKRDGEGGKDRDVGGAGNSGKRGRDIGEDGSGGAAAGMGNGVGNGMGSSSKRARVSTE